MIARLLSPSTASTGFSADQLPEAVHGSTLWNVMTPVVNSKSMTPTLQIGDELELERPDNLQVGDIVVYRHDRLFICHRIHWIEGDRLFLRGDANTGSFEEVDARHVVGRVTCLVRRGKRIAVSPYTRATIERAGRDSTWVRAVTWKSGRLLVLRSLNWVADRPVLKNILRSLLRRLMIVDILKRAPLHSFQGYIARERVHFDQFDNLHRCLSALNDERIVLVIRAGPLYLGTCTLNPRHIYMRPLFQRITTEVLCESIGLCLQTQTPLHSAQRSTTIRKQ